MRPQRPSPDPRERLARLPQFTHWPAVAALGVVAVLALGFFAKLAPGVLASETAVDEELTDHHMAWADWLSVTVSHIFSPLGAVLIVTVISLVFLIIRRSPASATIFAVGTTFGWLSSEVFKLVVGEPRPDGALLDSPLLAETGHDSFPSGHTTFVAALAISFFLLAWRTRWQRLVTVLGVVAVAAMAATRLYVSAHYLTDVIGSVLEALAAATIFTGLWNKYGSRVLNSMPLLRHFGPVPPLA